MSLYFEDYYGILLILVLSFGIALLIFVLSYALSTHSGDAEKLSTYECGFDPYEDARNAFDVRFYLVAILFLIFDVEAIFLFPWGVSLGDLSSFGFWGGIDFILELCLGLVYAWKMGSLEW